MNDGEATNEKTQKEKEADRFKYTLIALGCVTVVYAVLAMFVIPHPKDGSGSHDFRVATGIASGAILVLGIFGYSLFRFSGVKVEGTGWTTPLKYSVASLVALVFALVIVFASTYVLFGSDHSFTTSTCIASKHPMGHEAVCTTRQYLNPLGIMSGIYVTIGTLSTVGSTISPVNTTGRLIVAGQEIADVIAIVFFVFMFGALTQGPRSKIT